MAVRVDALRELPALKDAEVSAVRSKAVDEHYDEAYLWAPPVVVRVPHGDGGAEAADRLVWEMVAAIEGATKNARHDEAPIYVRAPAPSRSVKEVRGG